jgi:16S rRNA G966 N2-methylase RsmD
VKADIIQNDSRKIPLEDNSVDMVFIDSPYGDNIYSNHPDCIGKIPCEDERFYREPLKVVKESYRILKLWILFASLDVIKLLTLKNGRKGQRDIISI